MGGEQNSRSWPVMSQDYMSYYKKATSFIDKKYQIYNIYLLIRYSLGICKKKNSSVHFKMHFRAIHNGLTYNLSLWDIAQLLIRNLKYTHNHIDQICFSYNTHI